MAPGAFEFRPIVSRGRGATGRYSRYSKQRLTDGLIRSPYKYEANAPPVVKRSPVELLPDDLVKSYQHQKFYDIGTFAEVADVRYDAVGLWQSIDDLSRRGGPLELYNRIRGSRLVSIYPEGYKTNRVLIIYRRSPERQLIISFSGVAGLHLGHKIDYPGVAKDPNKETPQVCGALWAVYERIRTGIISEVHNCLGTYKPQAIIITGSGVGAAQATFFLLDILKYHWAGAKLRLFAFGCPRIGDLQFADHYTTETTRYNLNKDKSGDFKDYHVKGAHDRVPLLPTRAAGYAHHIWSSFFIFKGKIYEVPSSEREYARFIVNGDDERFSGLKLYRDSIPRFPYFSSTRASYSTEGRDPEFALKVLREIMSKTKFSPEWWSVYKELNRSRKRDWRRRRKTHWRP